MGLRSSVRLTYQRTAHGIIGRVMTSSPSRISNVQRTLRPNDRHRRDLARRDGLAVAGDSSAWLAIGSPPRSDDDAWRGANCAPDAASELCLEACAIFQDTNVMAGRAGQDRDVPAGMEGAEAVVVDEEDRAGPLADPAGQEPQTEA